MKRALATGGAVFIGSHVVDGLLEEGYEVSAVDDLSEGAWTAPSNRTINIVGRR